MLEGGVRKAGDRVRINVQLVEAESGKRLWAERFDRRLDDLFVVQDEITEEIVTALDIKLVSGEWARILRKTLRKPAALESYYHGWEALFRSSRKADIQEAQQYFEETIRQEPDSSVGYALAAWAYWWEVYNGATDDVGRTIERAERHSRKALSLEDMTGLPHLIMAQVYLLKKEYDRALEEAERAIVARPSCDGSYAVKAHILNYLGRSREAVDLAMHAIRLSPTYPPFYPAVLANAYYLSGRHEEAVTAAREVLERDRNNLDAHLVVAGAHAALGQLEEAREAAKEALKANPGFSLSEYANSQPYKDGHTLEKVLSDLRSAGLP